MSLYDGFFDSTQNEETGEYNRTYATGDFTDYFAKIIGSGVCIHGNPDSFLVRLEGEQAVVSPGYLFIQGYWLKNDTDYPIALPGDGNYAIVAHLNLGARMIELEARTIETAHTDSLVLAIVSPAAAEDTRHNTDLCGVIDTAGELSTKTAWAINYIDNEIESKLAGVEADIAAQAAKIDAKIAAVQAVADSIIPPPVGTIKFSASQDVGEEWLRCDGSFINEADYPELVAALGKLTPGVEDFKELLGAEDGEYVSNSCQYDGYVWVYLVKSMKLVGFNGSDKKEITVSGVNGLVELAAVDTVLSVCGGAVYLAQNNHAESTFILLESTEFTSSKTSIQMALLSVSAHTSGLDMSETVPRVVDVGGAKYMALGSYVKSAGSGGYYYYYLQYLKWDAGSFAEAVVFDLRQYYGPYTPSVSDKRIVSAYRAFSPKNSNEILLANGSLSSNSAPTFTIYSEAQKLYGTSSTQSFSSNDATKAALSSDPSINIIPVAGNNEYLFRAEITGGKLKITHGTYNPLSLYDWRTVDIALPSRARLFKESVCYAANQGLWFVFVGTGLLFTSRLADGTWGYLDTQETLGVIGQFGCADYDATNNWLYISGVASDGVPKFGLMQLPALYDYANDGAWLPMLASDGVPAYIKACEAGTNSVITDPVDMKITVTLDSNFVSYGSLLFNGEAISAAGTFTRQVSASGTFTVGVRLKESTGLNYYCKVSLNGTIIAKVKMNEAAGAVDSAFFKSSDYVKSGITLSGTYAL